MATCRLKEGLWREREFVNSRTQTGEIPDDSHDEPPTQRPKIFSKAKGFHETSTNFLPKKVFKGWRAGKRISTISLTAISVHRPEASHLYHRRFPVSSCGGDVGSTPLCYRWSPPAVHLRGMARLAGFVVRPVGFWKPVRSYRKYCFPPLKDDGSTTG